MYLLSSSFQKDKRLKTSTQFLGQIDSNLTGLLLDTYNDKQNYFQEDL